MAFDPTEQAVARSAEPPDEGLSNDIDRLLSEILNDPSVFSLLDSPSSSSSSAPSPPCFSPGTQQQEQEALPSLGQQQPQPLYLVPSGEQHSESSQYCAPETPSPTPSSTEDHQAFFPSSSSSLHTPPTLPRPHQHPTSLPLYQAPSYPHCQQTTTQPDSTLLNIEVVISPNVHDSYLRGQHGKITSHHQDVIGVFVYSLNQECLVARACISFVKPRIGDLVRVFHGHLAGATGWLCNCLGGLCNIQLCTRQLAQVEAKYVAKLSTDGNVLTPTCNTRNPLPSPLPSPTSPSLVQPLCTSPLLSPASLQNRHYASSCSSYSPTPYNSNQLNSPSYLQYSQQSRLPTYHETLRQNSRGGQLTELQKRMCKYQQEIVQRRLRSQNMKHLMQRARSASVKVGHKYGQHNSVVTSKQLDRPTEEIVEEIRRRTTLEYDFGSTGDGSELSSSCIQVPLICPLSQRRLSLPCRGVHCKHAQCFDAEAYIEFNKCVMRPKEKGCQGYSTQKQQLFKCPICSKHVSFTHLYVDKTLLQILQETDQDEVEFDKTGSWKPVEKKSLEDDVIDLTLEDEDSNSP